MSCKSCSSSNLRNFRTEIAVHLKVTDAPHIFVFPEILVCLNCGFSELVIEDDKLEVLAEDSLEWLLQRGKSVCCLPMIEIKRTSQSSAQKLFAGQNRVYGSD